MQHISIKNFGKIRDADVLLDGLTLIAGPNDTGKSTVGKLLFSIVQATSSYRSYYNFLKIDKLSKEFLDAFRYELRVAPQLDQLRSMRNTQNEFLYYRNNDSDEIMKGLYASLSQGKYQDDTTKILKDLKTLRVFLSSSRKYRNGHALTLLSMAIRFLEKQETNKKQFETVFSRICDDIFHGNLNNSLHRKDNAFINYKINKGSILKISSVDDHIACTFIKDNFAFSGATFIDSADSLEERIALRPMRFNDRMSDFDFSIKTDLKRKKNIAARKFKQENFYTEITTFIQKILGKASFRYDEEEQTIKYKVRRTAKNLDILNIASGSKIFGLLYILLKSGTLKKDELLILDEPENHLHPSWQIMFAELLVKMVSNGFNILLTSHSPYFIQAIKVYSEKYAILDNKVNFYAAQKIDNINYAKLINIKDSFGNLRDELIFKGLYEPFKTMEEVRRNIFRK